jgi:hypothetical protein
MVPGFQMMVLCPKRGSLSRKSLQAGHRWLTRVILATWKAEIRRITIPGQSRKKFYMTPCQTIVMMYICHSKAKVGRIMIPSQPYLNGKKLGAVVWCMSS